MQQLNNKLGFVNHYGRFNQTTKGQTHTQADKFLEQQGVRLLGQVKVLTRLPARFDRSKLISPESYYKTELPNLSQHHADGWSSSCCPFHSSAKPTLRVNLIHGNFKCPVCDIRGPDIISFHMQRYGLDFLEAAKQLGAWRRDIH